MNQRIIYMITCTRNGRMYVGKTKNPGQRWSSHRSKLRKGTHPCKDLQEDWDIWGAQFFTFRCVEIEEAGEDMEAVVLGRIGSERCYNTNMKTQAYEETLDAFDLPDEFY